MYLGFDSIITALKSCWFFCFCNDEYTAFRPTLSKAPYSFQGRSQRGPAPPAFLLSFNL